MNKPVRPNELDKVKASFEQRMQKLVTDQNRVARALTKALADARKQANHLHKTIPNLPLPEADRYLQKNPPSALALMILMRETLSRKGGSARAQKYTAARLYAEQYWRDHRAAIESQGKTYHAKPLAAMITKMPQYECEIDYRTVLSWWRELSN